MLAISALLLLLSGTAMAQVSSGTVRGEVLDQNRNAIPGARVELRAASSGFSRSAIAGAAGEFVLPGVPPGEYTLRAESPGLAGSQTAPFTVAIGQTAVQTITLQAAVLVERIEVTDKAAAIQATESTANVALGNERIEETPAASRNYLNFVLTAPGVAPASGSNARRSAATLRSPFSDSGFTFAGMRPRNNAISIDGVDNRDETTGGNRVAIGLEMVAEFRVSGTSAGVEYGNAAGGSVNVITRSGTNLWHGDVTYFAQHEFINARNPEAQVAGRPRSRRSQPGVSVNGPASKDRTFFSTAIEQQWESSEEWSEVPAAHIAAINARLREPLQRGLFPASGAQNEFSFKANHHAGERHALAARYAFSRGRATNDIQDADNFTSRSGRGSSLTRDHSLVLGWTAVARPSLVNDLRVQWSSRDNILTPNGTGPMVEIPGIVTFGQGWRLDSGRAESHAEAVEGLQWVRGKHQIQLGGAIHHVRLDARIANRFGGLAVFPDLAAFLDAAPGFYIRAVGVPETRFSTTPAGFWAGDKWQAVRGLTIEGGLRYDRQWMPAGLPASNRNFSPRLGFAWQPGGDSKWVLRTGAGLFFDRPQLAFLNDAIQKDGIQAREFFLTGAMAAEAYRSGAIPAGARASEYRAADALPSTYSRKITAGVERALGANTAFTAEFTQLLGLHLPRIRNAALGLPPVYRLEQNSTSSYRGAALSLNRRLSRDWTYLIAWNTGRTEDDASDFDEHPLDPADFRRDRALSRQHQAHRLTASGLFEIPEFDDLPAWIREPLEEITVAPIVSFGTGRPLNALLTSDAYGTGAWPISARPLGMARNAILTRGQFSIDIRLMKTIPFDNDRSRLQFGIESFNLTNRSNPLRFNPYYSTGTGKLASFGGVVETLNSRQFQFLIQFEY